MCVQILSSYKDMSHIWLVSPPLNYLILTYLMSSVWKILKEMGIPDHLTGLLRNLYAGQEATVRPGHETAHWFKIGKGVCQGCMLSPCLFNLYAEYIMQMPGWMKPKLESKLPGEISITSDTQMTPPLWQKAKNSRAYWWKWKRRVKKLA